MTPDETAGLFATLRSLRAAGLLVVLVTHKLEEAPALRVWENALLAALALASRGAPAPAALAQRRSTTQAPD